MSSSTKHDSGMWWLILPEKGGLTGAAYHVQGTSADIELAAAELYVKHGRLPIVTGKKFELILEEESE